jgi:hypothetical protein
MDREEFLERAAIIEFCGNVSRKEAERLARLQHGAVTSLQYGCPKKGLGNGLDHVGFSPTPCCKSIQE